MKLLFMQLVVSVFAMLATTSKVCGQTTSATDYFRSGGTGNWNVAGSWQSSADGSTNWIISTMVPTQAANLITIRSGHTITINNNTTVDQVVIASGGILELATGASTSLTVNDGVGNDIIVQSGGIFKHNISGSTSPLPSFTGFATIEIQDGGILEAANNNGTASNYAVTTSSISNNVLWDDNSIFNWNNTSSPSNGVTYFPASAAIPIFRFSSAASVGGTNPTVVNGLLEANATVSLASTGTKTLRYGIIGTGTVTSTAVNGGQFIIDGATAKLGGGSLVLNNNGLMISSSAAVTLSSNKTITNYVNNATSPSTSATATVTISGTLTTADYIIDGNCKIQINGTVKTTNANGLSGAANTTFTNNLTINSLGASSVIEYARLGDQTITPYSYANLNISGSGIKKIVAASDVGITGICDIASSNTLALNGTNHLNLSSSSTLTINTNAIFDNGGESHVTGGTNINISGTFITRAAAGFTGSTSTAISGVTNTAVLAIYAGSTIEYGALGDQQVTSRNDYSNITFSGSGTKTIPTMVPYGTVTIKDNAIADAANKTFGNDNTSLTMTGGRFKVGGTGTKPDINGTYNITGGDIEFTNSGATSETIRPAKYFNIIVSGSNVKNSAGIITLINGGTFTVKTGGIYDNNAFRIDGTSGTQSFVLEAGATFKTGVTAGFSGVGSEALTGIETFTVDPKSTIIYSKTTDQTITPLSGNYPTLLLKGGGIKTVATGTLSIAPTADSVVIDPLVTLKVSSGAKANFNSRPVTVHSNASGTGFIGEITDGSSALLNATNVTVERYIPAKRAFRFLSSPVTTSTSIKANWMEGQNNPPPAYSVNNNNNPGYGTHITGSSDPNNGFDATATNNPSLFTFNNSSQTWVAVPNTTGTLTAGAAYRLLVRGSRSVDLSSNSATPSNTILRTTGSIQAGTINFSSGTNPSIISNTDYYSLIGNPYASSIDWNALSKSGLSSYYYVWDPSLNTRGAYVSYGNGVTSVQSSQVNENIQPAQAFFVQTKGANPSLTFNETNKTTVNRNVFRTYSNITKLSVQLLLDTTNESQHTADGVTILFDPSFKRDIDIDDAGKISNLDESMSIRRDSILLSTEGRPDIVTSDTIPLNIVQFRQKSYFLEFDPKNFSSDLTAVTKDNYSGKETAVDLNLRTILPFSITADSASFNPARFSIIFTSSKILPISFTDIKAYKIGKQIKVDWTVQTENGIDRYEVQRSINGHEFEKIATVEAKANEGALSTYTWSDESVNNGIYYYRIKSIQKTGTIVYSNVARVTIDDNTNALAIYPNPIEGNQINLKIQNLRKGNYNLSIFNDNAQSIYTTKLRYNGGVEQFTITPNNFIPKGVYKVKISDGERVNVESIILKQSEIK